MYIVTVQDSLEDVVSDIASGKVAEESVWVARRSSEDEEHQQFFQLSATLDGEVQFASDQCHLQQSGNNYTLTIKDDKASSTYKLQTPVSKTAVARAQQAITAISMSPDGSVLLAGNDKGDLLQYDTSTKQLTSSISGAHYAAVIKTVVLPSGKTALSVGADLQAKLWPLFSTTAEATRVFLDQKKTITDLAIIGRGRNFLTSSMDGSVNLWECSTGQVVSKFRRIGGLEDPATCLAIGHGKPEKEENIVHGDLLFECNDVVVYVGYQSGVIQQYSVAGHYQTKFHLQRNSAVSSIAATEKFLVVGLENGMVEVHEISGGSSWQLQLNSAHSVENITVEKSSALKFTLSNGPETLLRVTFAAGTFEYVYLVGLSEMFRVQSVGSSSQGTIVATADEIAQY